MHREGDATGDERRTIVGDGVEYMKMEKRRGTDGTYNKLQYACHHNISTKVLYKKE